jgi:hypothetical protein
VGLLEKAGANCVVFVVHIVVLCAVGVVLLDRVFKLGKIRQFF